MGSKEYESMFRDTNSSSSKNIVRVDKEVCTLISEKQEQRLKSVNSRNKSIKRTMEGLIAILWSDHSAVVC